MFSFQLRPGERTAANLLSLDEYVCSMYGLAHACLYVFFWAVFFFLWSQRLLSSSEECDNMRGKVAWSWWPEAWRLGVAWHRQRPTWEAHQKLCLATNSAPLLVTRLQSGLTCAAVKPAGEEVKMQHRRQNADQTRGPVQEERNKGWQTYLASLPVRFRFTTSSTASQVNIFLPT